MDETAELSLEVRRTIDASPEEVFRIWTDPEQIPNWWPSEGMAEITAEADVRVGGEFRIGMTTPDGEKPQFAVGTYLEVDPPKRLVHTWKWEGWPEELAETRVEIDFLGSGGRTEVVVRHSGFGTEKMAGDHKDGWNACLEKIAGLL